MVAINKTLHRSSGNDAVRNQHKYIGILQSKMDVLNMVQWHGAATTIATFKPGNLKKLATEATSIFSPCLELLKNINHKNDLPEEAWIKKFNEATEAAIKFENTCKLFTDRFVFWAFGWQAEASTYLEGSFGRERCNSLVEELQSVLQRWEFVGSLENDPKFLRLCRCEEAASSWMTDFSAENAAEKKTKFLEELTKALSEVENFQADASAVLSIIGFADDGQITGELTKFKLLKFVAGLGMLRCRHACKRILSYALELKVGQGKPLPIPVEDELPMLFDLEVMNGLAGAAETEDDNKRLRAALKLRCETLDKLVKSVGTSQTEVLNNVQAADRKAQSEKAKAERLAKAEEEKKKKKAATEAAKKKGSPDAAAVAATTSKFPLMDLEHDGIKSWLEFASPKALQDEFNAKKIDFTVPFVLHKSETIEAAVDDRAVKAAVAIFKIQYPSSSQAKTEGKGQTPYQGNSKDKLKEALCELVPAPFHATWDAKEAENNVAAKSVAAVSVAGFSPGNVYQGLEKQSLATIRHIISGRRQVMVFNYMHLSAYAKEKKIESVQGKKHEDFVTEVVETLSADDGAMDLFYKLGGTVHRASLKPGDTYFVPQCCWMLERTVGDTTCFGIRTSVLLRAPKASQGYEKFREDYEKIHGEDSVVKFWHKLNSLLPTPKE